MKEQIFRVATVARKNGKGKHDSKRVVQLTLTARTDSKTGVCDFRHCKLLEALAGAFSNADGFAQMVIEDYAVKVKRFY